MTVFLEGPTVTIAELSKAVKTNSRAVEDEARALGCFIGTDWASRPAVSTDDAYALASGKGRLEHDGRQASLAHMAALEEWEAAKRAARQAAGRPVYEEQMRTGRGAAVAAQKAAEAGEAAAAQFEREHPAPLYGEAATESTFGRVMARMKEAVR